MSNFRDRLIRILQTTGQLEGRADDVADAIIREFGFYEAKRRLSGKDEVAIIGWMDEQLSEFDKPV